MGSVQLEFIIISNLLRTLGTIPSFEGESSVFSCREMELYYMNREEEDNKQSQQWNVRVANVRRLGRFGLASMETHSRSCSIATRCVCVCVRVCVCVCVDVDVDPHMGELSGVDNKYVTTKCTALRTLHTHSHTPVQ